MGSEAKSSLGGAGKPGHLSKVLSVFLPRLQPRRPAWGGQNGLESCNSSPGIFPVCTSPTEAPPTCVWSPQQCFTYLLNLAFLPVTFRTPGCCVSWGPTSRAGTYEVPMTGATRCSWCLPPAHSAGPLPGLLRSCLRLPQHMLVRELTVVLSR